MIGRTISYYKILEKLGEGGMGAVYKARDTRLDRSVALKFISTGTGNDCAEILAEARVTAAINHPNVCALLDVHDSGDEPFLVMEYIDGHSLRSEIERGPLDVGRAVGLAMQVTEGLKAAHKKGFIHRDVKPENILITADGVAKVTDFGLARKADVSSTAEFLSGTIAYMSPEQLRGEKLDRQTDIWSLGVVLHEMIAGTRPFRGEYHEALMYSIANEAPPPLREEKPGSMGGVGKAVGRCLEKIPEVRYPDAEALLADLKEVLGRLEHPEDCLEKAIAVMPFSDLSAGGDNRYFSDGLTEEIINDISKIKTLKVVSRTTVTQYNRAEKNTKQIASDLGVQYLLEGSVRKRGSDLLITAQLIDAAADTYLWSEKYPGTMDDIFSIQETVAARIAKALRVRLSPREKRTIKKRPTRSAEAYQLYLKGRFQWNRRNLEGIEAAIRYFQRAIRKDSKYALAWTGLSDAYNLLSEYKRLTRDENYSKAKKAVLHALELDPQLAEARTSLASLLMLYEWDWATAEKEFRLSLYLKPDYSTTHHWLAELLNFTGRGEEAIRTAARATELEPTSPAIVKDEGLVLYYNQRFDGAIEMAKRSLAMDKTFVAAHRLISLALSGLGRTAEAIAENDLWGEITGYRDEADIWRSYLYAAGGEKQKARKILASVPRDGFTSGFHFRALAVAHANIGEPDEAFAWLRKAIDLRSEAVCSLKVDFKFTPLREDPRYREMLTMIGLPV